MYRRLPLATSFLLLPALVLSQSVRGAIVERGTASPLTGVVVLLVDSVGNAVARALTNESGEYRLILPRPGTFRVRTLRIGFRPVTSDPITVGPDQEVTRQLDIAAVPFLLDTVRIAGRSVCRGVGDSVLATYAVWEQVRTALTATQLTARERAISATVLTYESSIDPATRHVREQSSSVESGFVTRAWRSLPSDSVRRVGYIVEEGSGDFVLTTYYAPGLDVLLSDAFLEDHCFRLVSSSDTTLLGVQFEPSSGRRRIPEIRGTIWLDRRSSELRRMEFRYVNVSRDQETHAGGEMEFARMKNGTWAISQWNIRMPVLEQRNANHGRRTLPGLETVVSELRLAGGELLLAMRAGDTLWSRPLILAGIVTDSASRTIANARVSLRSTERTSVTDSAGRFTIAGVLPGSYTLETRTPELDSMDAVHRSVVTVARMPSPVHVRVPTAGQVAASLCGPRTQPATVGAGIILGTIPGRDSFALRNVRVVAEWSEASGRLPQVHWVESRTDSRGQFRMCGLPLDATITLRAHGTIAASRMIQFPEARRFLRAELTADTTNRNAVLAGVVLADSTRQPISGAEIAFPGLSRNVFANESGAFRISGLPPGEHQVVVRRIGYGGLDSRITFAANQVVERQIFLTRLILLDTVAVTASAVLPDFEEHRRLGLGSFITRAELEKLEGRTLGAILAQVRGARVVRAGSHAWVASSRGVRSINPSITKLDPMDSIQGARPGECYALVYLDNVMIYRGKSHEPLFDTRSVSPEQIEAIEYYAGPAEMPAKYSTLNTQCGVLVIHTRRASK